MIIIYLSVLAGFLTLIHLAFNYNERARLLKKIPGPKYAFIIGNALEIIASPVELMKLARVYSKRWKNIYRFWCFPFGAVTIFNPKDIEVIISNVRFNDKSEVYELLKPWLRDGLLVSSGEKWQQRRKLLTPSFHFNILRQFLIIVEENSRRMVNELDKSAGEDVDIVPVLSEFTLNSICETAMGTALIEETTGAGKSYKKAIYGLGQIVLYRFSRVYLYPSIFFYLSAAAKKMMHYLNLVHSFTQRVIRDRREYVNKHGIKAADIEDEDDVYKKRKKTAMLDLLLLAEKDGLIDNVGIQEEVDTFMFEGHDTTASGLTFALMKLANNRIIQNKIYNELKEIFGDSTRAATMEDQTKMRYLECCIKESLRLYPPVHFISRKLKENVILSGYTVPSGTLCHINIMDLHRSPDLYEHPLKFDPDRFLPKNSVGRSRHPYSYIPFSAGPRNCIGQKFAMMEMKSAISEILRKFELLPVTRAESLEFTADLVLRNVGPVYVSFAKR